jgi:succinyl-CoA synthetase beta subunit
MARKKISEFTAKTILHKSLGLPYDGMSYDSQSGAFSEHAQSLQISKKYVVKVDQGIKKRFKNGLLKLDVSVPEITNAIKELEHKGYSRFIIEEYFSYDTTAERYLALARTRAGIEAYYSNKGGVDIEENSESIKKFVFPYSENDSKEAQSEFAQMQNTLGIDWKIVQTILSVFETNYFSFLEINPLVIRDNDFLILDLAVEVDSTAEFFVDNAWSANDFVEPTVVQKTREEIAINELAEKSQAAFSYTMLNPNGSVWMLLSGGGASIVLADEVANVGKGNELANYGEYSGNPNGEETYIYTKNVLSLMLKSSASKKVLIVGGGVANFTDIRITFKGVIQALDEYKEKLQEQGIKVYVRRGGPKQTEGLLMMKEFLEKNNLYGFVSGPDMVLTDIVSKAILNIK